jgi:hypothetical protein
MDAHKGRIEAKMAAWIEVTEACVGNLRANLEKAAAERP